MSDANSIENVVTQGNETVEPKQPDAVQARINELTAEKYAQAEQLKAQAAQIAELVRSVAQRQAPQEQPNLPEGIDPNVAKYFESKFEAQQKAIQAQTEQLFWRTQHQLDQQAVNAKYAGMPEEVRQDAAKRLTSMQQRYGNAATMEDAVKFAHYEYLMKQAARGNAAAFNGMNGPMAMQGGSMNVGGNTAPGSGALAPPSQRQDWHNLDLDTQNKLITEYEKKGGSLF